MELPEVTFLGSDNHGICLHFILHLKCFNDHSALQNFAINSLNKCMRQVQGLVCLYLSYDPRLNTLLSLTFPFVVDQSQYSGSITLNARSASGELLDLRRRFSMMQSRS
ncbi:uncharacterized protein LOC121971341 isoform X4 [Zingiber officinale]|uniref:uncharacterized protein LOC121971341 isoform X4 n=1 Tax=Zingiber officinale TaxID=94328 RepID=UPI001C4AE054|nr:uncharacterized protein LOC121971341 isoform X4 [Zingiber officinale]